jgi:hypothetical protein
MTDAAPSARASHSRTVGRSGPTSGRPTSAPLSCVPTDVRTPSTARPGTHLADQTNRTSVTRRVARMRKAWAKGQGGHFADRGVPGDADSDRCRSTSLRRSTCPQRRVTHTSLSARCSPSDRGTSLDVSPTHVRKFRSVESGSTLPGRWQSQRLGRGLPGSMGAGTHRPDVRRQRRHRAGREGVPVSGRCCSRESRHWMLLRPRSSTPRAGSRCPRGD